MFLYNNVKIIHEVNPKDKKYSITNRVYIKCHIYLNKIKQSLTFLIFLTNIEERYNY